MPVIGRLDEQVNEIIISPVSQRRRDKEQPSQQPGEAPPVTSDSAETGPEHATVPRTSSVDESADGPDELPVWLL
jgi:hypothetical protein